MCLLFHPQMTFFLSLDVVSNPILSLFFGFEKEKSQNSRNTLYFKNITVFFLCWVDPCAEYQGMSHPRVERMCCSKDCGDYCGATDCGKGPGGCCMSRIPGDQVCGTNQTAPCFLPTDSESTFDFEAKKNRQKVLFQSSLTKHQNGVKVTILSLGLKKNQSKNTWALVRNS